MASIVAVAVFSITVAPIAPSAFADPEFTPGEENWGKATKWYAQHYDMGEHSKNSDFNGDEPGRVGLGNLKNELGSWCNLLDFLNGIDDEAVLTCAEQAEE